MPRCPENGYHRELRRKSTISNWQTAYTLCYLISWDNRHFERPCKWYPPWNIRHENAVGALGVAFAHSGQQAHCLSEIQRSFFVISWPSMKHGFTSTHHRLRNSRNSVIYPVNLLWKRRDFKDVIYTDYWDKSKNITGLYYIELLGRFNVELSKKRPYLRKNCFPITITNRLTHPPPLLQLKRSIWSTNCYPSPPYWLFCNLASCDFFLITNLKKITPILGRNLTPRL